jgi:hypothetical protein
LIQQIANAVNIERLLELYLLGLLADEDREKTEMWFFGDIARLEILSLAEESLIEKYVTGDLDALRRQQFVAHFLKTEDRVEKLRLYSNLHSYITRETIEPQRRAISSTSNNICTERTAIASSDVETFPRVPRVFSIMKNFRSFIVRFARWAGWLYFVDEELLDYYMRYQESAKR